MKSYVTIEQKQCVVCLEVFDSGALLFDGRLRDRFDHFTLTGLSLCEKCEGKKAEGFIALIEIDPAKSNGRGDRINQSEAYRTGRLCHLKKHVAADLFDCEITDHVAFIDPGIFAMLEKLSCDIAS